MGESKLNLLILKTGDKYFVTDNVDGKSYFNTVLGGYYFDGEKLTSAFKDNWKTIKNIPNKIQFKLPDVPSNHRFELIAGNESPLSKTLPLVIEGKTLVDTEYENLYGLYRSKCDYTDGGFQDVEFEYELITEDDNFYLEKPKYKYSVDIITQLTVHKDLRINRPCNINSEDLFKVVREYIKLNINPVYARITSDYDFCFTVKKLIPLTEIKSYQVDISRTKRHKWITKFVKDREIEVFQLAPKSYNGYPIIEPIHGENYQDLEKNIDKYLSDLIKYINEPLVDCPHCEGRGVILK